METINEQPGAKRPYVKPAVIEEEVFETMALSCARADEFECPEFVTNQS